ncbi:MAG: hypothetical protein IKH36_00150 [Bacilli bacterium]|nr:hypothetical protein [Bacilli bacterium]
MNISLIKLFSGVVDRIDINEEITIPEEYYTYDIKSISPVKLDGYLYLDELDNLSINLNVKCNLTLKSSISLKDVDFPININIDELDFDDENKKITNSIDLIPIIWQNILIEIPIRVTDSSNDEDISDKYIKKEEIDERLSKLKDFLDE